MLSGHMPDRGLPIAEQANKHTHGRKWESCAPPPPFAEFSVLLLRFDVASVLLPSPGGLE